MAAYIVMENGTEHFFHVGQPLPITKEEIQNVDYVRVDGHEQNILPHFFTLKVQVIATVLAKTYCQLFGEKYGFLESVEKEYSIPIIYRCLETFNVTATNLQEAMEKAMYVFQNTPDDKYLDGEIFDFEDISDEYPDEDFNFTWDGGVSNGQ